MLGVAHGHAGKLMRVRARWKLLLPGSLFLMILSGCPLPQRKPPPAPPPAEAAAAAHLGTPYQIVSQDSLLTILVYRGGALASAGHNHVIASHDLSGTIYVPAAILESSFEVHVPVDTLTVDEEGTRHNMLGAALLDAQHNPEIVLRAVQLERAGEATAESAEVLVHVQSTVRGQLRTFTAPVRYRLTRDGTLEASGEFPLRQSDLGLTPFSAMLGALQVQDEMRVSFHIVAHSAAVEAAPPATP
jgi:polyisoprenoid-binding protein YceI